MSTPENENSTLPGVTVREETPDTSVEGESPLAAITRPRADDTAVQAETPELSKAPAANQFGINDAATQGETPVATGGAAAAAAALAASGEQIGMTRSERRAQQRAAQEASVDTQKAALAAEQAAQARDAIIPTAVSSVKSTVAPLVVDTTSQTAGNKGVVSLRDQNITGRAAPAPTPAQNVNAAGNIVRQNSRLVEQEKKKEEAKLASQQLKEDLDRILADVPPAYRGDIVRLEQYCVAMAPGRPISDAAGAAQQVALFRLLQNIINRQDRFFQQLFTAVLRIFRAHSNGALSDTCRNRFDGHIAMSREERRALQKITHLLALAADPKTRSIITKSIDVDAALEDGLTEEGRARVSSFLQS